jgi:RNA polymerase sigma-70 factor (ECF subfamily)
MLADSSPVQRGKGGVEWTRESTLMGGTLVRVRFPPADPEMSGSLKEISTTDLVRRIREGDPAAEAELVARFSEGLSFLLRRWTRDRTIAEDLFQETFRLALEKIRKGEVRDPERLAGFLRSLAKNLSIEHYRRGSRREVREEEIEAAAELTAPETGQLGHLLRQEKAALIRQVLEELGSERDRQVLFRFYIAEEDKEQIRSDLGLTGPEFNLVLFRARRRYRDLYERHAAKGRE